MRKVSKVRKSLIRRRNSSAEDCEDYRRKSKGDEEDEDSVGQCRPRANSKHSYLARMRSKSDEEVFESSLDRRYTRRKTVTKRKNGSRLDLGSSTFWSRTEDLQRGRVRSLASYYENSDSEQHSRTSHRHIVQHTHLDEKLDRNLARNDYNLISIPNPTLLSTSIPDLVSQVAFSGCYMMSCELLSYHGPTNPKIVYHNAQWTSHPGSPNYQSFSPNHDSRFNNHDSFHSFDPHQCRGQENWANSTYPSWGRRHTLDHINVSPLETSRKRQKVSRPSNSFRRKSLLFFKMLGSGEWRDRSEKYEVQKCVREDEPVSPIEEICPSRPNQTTPTRRFIEEDGEVNRTVSDSQEGVVLRRRSRGGVRRRSRQSIAHTEELSSSLPYFSTPKPPTSQPRDFPFTDDLPPRPVKPPRPASCYINSAMKTSPEPATGSGFQRKLRRLSASVKNFSLERMIHHRKHSGPLKEEDVNQVSLPGSFVEVRRISDPSIANRKSLPADFRYENVSNFFAAEQLGGKSWPLCYNPSCSFHLYRADLNVYIFLQPSYPAHFLPGFLLPAF
ncbi:hypothetical protein ACHWQZ_G015020 [Mnemiopsis leidyi]